MKDNGKLAHVEHIPIRWGDMDAMGHVNNVVYFRFMEQARISWFERLGRGAWSAHGIVVANAACNFRRAMTYPGTVEVKLFAAKPGGSSVATYYEMRVDQDPEPYADGAAVVVFIDMRTQKAVRIPEEIRALLQ